MKIQKKDFIEIEFTGRTKEGIIFDSTIKEDLEKADLGEVTAKPFIYSVGSGMFLDSLDEFLIDKETGKNYEVELTPEKSFGKRNSQLVKLLPMSVFRQQRLNPVAGMSFSFDNQIAKIISVSGGRVIVDFNNPLAGKNVVYNIKVMKKIENIEEKIKSLMDFFFKKEFPFEIKEKKLIMEVEPPFDKIIELLKPKFLETLDLEIEAKLVNSKESEKVSEKEIEKVEKE
jgi:FKBP-type peptidyl-prolyl cis-trans isomerase 2